MKYLTEGLYLHCFEGSKYEQNKDKFLIGILNEEREF